MLKDWIQLAREKGASDIHIEANTPLVLRVRGELAPVGQPIQRDLLIQVTQDLLGRELWADFADRRSVDLSQTIAGTRCRINVYQTARGVGLAIRLLYSFHNTLKDCNLHPDLRRFVKSPTGLVIISGPTGSGKSTTLAALIEEMNSTERKHILSIESPIEYFYTNKQSFIRQREVLSHTPSYEQAIVDAMREDPDVLIISEIRTPDVMRLTLNAAETGHLVLATMHSSSCAEALTRLCMSFPSDIQASIRAQLADCLLGVICQRLLYLPQHQIRVPQCEVLVANSGAKATIRNGQFSQIISSIQAGGEEGMWSFERYQRWIEQKRDWVRPSKASPVEDNEVSPSSSRIPFETSRTFQKPVAPPTSGNISKPTPGPSPRPDSNPSPRPSAPSEMNRSPSSDEGRIEISTVDEDLEELGRQLVKKYGEDDR